MPSMSGFRPPPIGQGSCNDDDNGSVLSEFKFYPVSVEQSVENIENYTLGGYHPVRLGDILGEGRYSIAHKLGHGGFSTTWIAKDNREHRYVALKIGMADDSPDYKDYTVVKSLHDSCPEGGSSKISMINGFDDVFWHNGPNGTHMCLVSKLLGPSISSLSRDCCQLYPIRAKEVLFQATQGLAFLHSQGICHGDFTSSNILLEFSKGFDNASLDHLYELVGAPRKHEVYRYDDEPLGPHDPPYIVEAVAWNEHYHALEINSNIKIIDFDQSFRSNEPPTRMLGTPSAYLSPESIFEASPSVASDVWALGCTIFRVRAGYDLFGTFEGSPAEALKQMTRVLGNFSQSWASIRFDYEDGMPIPDSDTATEGSVLETEPITLTDPLLKKISQIQDPTTTKGLTNFSEGNSNKDLFWVCDAEPDSPSHSDAEERVRHEGHSNMSTEEVLALYNLLSKIFVCDPQQRPTAEDILQHPWFKDVRNLRCS